MIRAAATTSSQITLAPVEASGPPGPLRFGVSPGLPGLPGEPGTPDVVVTVAGGSVAPVVDVVAVVVTVPGVPGVMGGGMRRVEGGGVEGGVECPRGT